MGHRAEGFLTMAYGLWPSALPLVRILFPIFIPGEGLNPAVFCLSSQPCPRWDGVFDLTDGLTFRGRPSRKVTSHVRDH